MTDRPSARARVAQTVPTTPPQITSAPPIVGPSPADITRGPFTHTIRGKTVVLNQVQDDPERITMIAVVRAGTRYQARGYILEHGKLLGWYPIRDREYLSHAMNHASLELENVVARARRGRYEGGGV